ncbi:hypothetical protein Mal48_31530 [Thalassoglobus polymorphus]|uniref:Glycosyltransferase RgtA/B/C/D-like domain-containing protein n=2 Tax=Thalassoglobus polymorphus TaxID=2527994 RepID=A0A517QQJ2_9PLAN|nr:hypothetical protein Mal48_31530 [Thalassoglobus polymorphus]
MDFADPDLWGHVQYGQEILEEGVLPRTNTWSFTAEGTRWINHENIAELVMASVTNAFGPRGLTFGKYLFGWILLGIIWWRARVNGVHQIVAAFICLVVAFSIQFHWHFRPQIFGYVFFGMMSALLFWCFQRDEQGEISTKRLLQLFWLLPLIAIWANTHGSFAAGVCVAIACLGLRFIELILSKVWSRSNGEAISLETRKALAILPIVGFGICAATLLTPYGIELHQWMWGALHEPRPEIGDWESPSLFSFSREVVGFWVMVVTVLLAAKVRQRADWVQLIVFGLIATQAISHIRHLPLLAILWASWFAVEINDVAVRFLADLKNEQKKLAEKTEEKPASKRLWQRPILVQGVLGIWIVSVAVATAPKLGTLNVPRDKYPVDAFKFMAEHGLEGRTVVTFNWAQYAIGFFANEKMDSTVAIDGRFRTCYPQEIIDVYFDFTFGEDYEGPRHRSSQSGPIDSSRALSFKNPELILISRLQEPSVRVMNRHQEDWSLLYQDDLAQIWGPKNRFDNPASEDYLAASRRVITNEAKVKTPAEWPAFATQSELRINQRNKQIATTH